MRLFFTTTLCVCCSLVFPWTCLSQDTKPVESVASPVESKAKSVETTVTTKQTQQFVLRVRTAEKVDFAGTVTAVDRESSIISIRNQSKTISFDMSKSILIGYRDTAEIRQGDKVSVGYTKYGLQIRKGSFAVTRQEKPFIPQKTLQQQTATTRQKIGVPIRMVSSANNKTFSGIDNDKDGKLSPIELCVLKSDLTLEAFRQFDKNGDGFLNQQEYRSANLGR